VTDLAVRVAHLGKRYRIGERQPYKSLRESLTSAVRGRLRGDSRMPRETIWALRDVSFEIERGEVIGVIGRNGAGKSTLLKILARITDPTEGRVEVHGRVGSLLEVGTGFHMELTGRENIYLNGAILGMKKAEIESKFDEIVAFAEIEQFLDTPVKHYSTGMYLRLAFAVAAHLEPEILLVDEVLAVGDAAFQKKCLGKMGDVAQQGRTVVFVSHDLAAIRQLVGTALLLDRGGLKAAGLPAEIVRLYLSDADATRARLDTRRDRKGTQAVKGIGIRVVGEGRQAGSLAAGDEATFELEYLSNLPTPIEGIELTFGVYDALGRAVTFLENAALKVDLAASPGRGSFRCRVPHLPLPPGRYYLNFHLHHHRDLLDWVERATWFDVFAGDFFGTGKLTFTGLGGVFVGQDWEVARPGAARPGASHPSAYHDLDG
jgi:lipopolysaccharide transport system ATP-binding protein